MEIGKLNRRITVTTYSANTPNEYGGFELGTGTSVDTWCHAKPLSQSEQLLNGLQLGQRVYEFTFRYEKGNTITQRTGLTYENREFRVISILEIDENKRVVKVLANERTN